MTPASGSEREGGGRRRGQEFFLLLLVVVTYFTNAKVADLFWLATPFWFLFSTSTCPSGFFILSVDEWAPSNSFGILVDVYYVMENINITLWRHMDHVTLGPQPTTKGRKFKVVRRRLTMSFSATVLSRLLSQLVWWIFDGLWCVNWYELFHWLDTRLD